MLVAGAALVLSGCSFDGLQGVDLPGTPGTGAGAYQVVVELPDVGTLVENAEVKVDDIAVGTVTDLRVVDWHAEATVSLAQGTKLPSDAVARIGYNSLLGAAYLELSAPDRAAVAPASEVALLEDGDTIPLERGGAYPSTERVLAATSVVLNGGGLRQVRTITVELNRALATESGQGVRTLLPRLNSFVGALDDQRTDIVTALDNLELLSTSFEKDIDVVELALDDLEPGLAVLTKQRRQLTKALTSLDDLSDVATRLVSLSETDLQRVLEDLAPTLLALHRTGDDTVHGLRYLLTPPFAPEHVPSACRGDYCNLFLRLDLSLQALLENFLGAGPNGDTSPGLLGENGDPLEGLDDLVEGLGGGDELVDELVQSLGLGSRRGTSRKAQP